MAGAGRSVTVGAARTCSRAALRMRALLAMLAAALMGLGAPVLAATEDPAWDQVENIKEAATHLARIQQAQGATAAFNFIDACYRTHRLSSAYTRAFEACIAQDYLETQVLTLVYSRMPPEALQRMGAPSPERLVATMTHRVGAAFAQYNVSKERIAEFKRNIDEHGFPLLMRTLFPEMKSPEPPQKPGLEKEGTPAAKPDRASPDAPSPDTPTPDQPSADKPVPDKPGPESHTPDTPTSDKPSPDQPSPDKK
ncbi:MAG TPA: hypothetical protein VNR51_10985 [Hyphomicrobium sp.]|nr:hypothetical protein [Hyphomicrobium sp.]